VPTHVGNQNKDIVQIHKSVAALSAVFQLPNPFSVVKNVNRDFDTDEDSSASARNTDSGTPLPRSVSGSGQWTTVSRHQKRKKKASPPSEGDTGRSMRQKSLTSSTQNTGAAIVIQEKVTLNNGNEIDPANIIQEKVSSNNENQIESNNIPMEYILSSDPPNQDEIEVIPSASDAESNYDSDIEAFVNYESWEHLDLKGPMSNELLSVFISTHLRFKKLTRRRIELAFQDLTVPHDEFKIMVTRLNTELMTSNNSLLKSKLTALLKAWPLPIT